MYQYGAISGSVNGSDGSWIWGLQHSMDGVFTVPANSDDPITVLGLTLPTFGTVVHTVKTFNAQAEAGRDPLFHKAWLRPLTQAPFAAISYCSADLEAHAFTLGGLATRPGGEVLDGDGEPIAGLFAAGRCACGLARWGEGYSSGLSLGDSTFFGRMAGRTAAA